MTSTAFKSGDAHPDEQESIIASLEASGHIAKVCTSTTIAPKEAVKIKKNGVGFGLVQLHTYRFVLGDNPSVTEGLPISFDWKVQSSERHLLDEYEEKRKNEAGGEKKAKGPRRLDPFDRYALMLQAGHSHGSMRRIDKEVRKIKKHRRKSELDDSEYGDGHEDSKLSFKSIFGCCLFRHKKCFEQ